MVAKTFLRLDFIKKSILVRLTSRIFLQFEDGSVSGAGCCSDGCPLLSGCISGELIDQVLKDLAADWFCEQVCDVQFGVDPPDVHEAELDGLLVVVITQVGVLIARADEVFSADSICLCVVSEYGCWLFQDFRIDSELFQELTEPDDFLCCCGDVHVRIVLTAQAHMLQFLTLCCHRSCELGNDEACLCEAIGWVCFVACIRVSDWQVISFQAETDASVFVLCQVFDHVHCSSECFVGWSRHN